MLRSFKYLLFAGIILLLAGCSAQQRLNRILQHHPELVTWDTIHTSDTFITEHLYIDTATIIRQHDSIIVTRDNLVIKVIRTAGDTIRIKGECKADTIVKIKAIAVPYVKHPPEPTFWQKIWQRKYWILAILFLWSGWIATIKYRR